MAAQPRFGIVFGRGVALGAVLGAVLGAAAWSPLAFGSVGAFALTLLAASVGAFVGIGLGALGGAGTALVARTAGRPGVARRRGFAGPRLAAAGAVALPPVVVGIVVTDQGRLVAFGFAAFVAVVGAVVSPFLLRPAGVR